MIVARAWRIHPDDLLQTDGRTWAAMLNQLSREAEARS